jgi:2-methylcitrate dehydratase PrpD
MKARTPSSDASDPGHETPAPSGLQKIPNDVSIKPLYPCCKFIHGPIDAVLQAVEDTGAGADAIERIRVVVTNKEVYDLVCTTRERKWNPASITDAQFSLPFMLAWAVVHRRIGFESVAASSLADPAVKALMPRIEIDLQTGAQTDGRGTFPMPGIVTVIERSGRETQRTVEYVKGHPKNPMSYDEVAAKFLACARFGRPGWKGAGQVVEQVRALEEMGDCGALVRVGGLPHKVMRRHVAWMLPTALHLFAEGLQLVQRSRHHVVQ